MSGEIDRLAALAGRWTGAETLFPRGDDPGGNARATVDAHWILERQFLATDYCSEREGHVPYRGLGVTGWDEGESCYTLSWFDSMGSSHATPARGRWDEDLLVFELKRGHRRTRYTYRFEEGRYLFHIDHSHDGVAWTPSMHGIYTRA